MSTATPSSPRTTTEQQPEERPAQTYRITAPAVPITVRVVRDAVAAALIANGAGSLAEDARLCVSETVTNVVSHARVPHLDVEVTVQSDRAVIAVRDSSTSGRLPLARAVSTDDESGRGLLLVSRIAAHWGAQWAWDQDGVRLIGKRVWFELRTDHAVSA
ncbi:ATP-binding protein [Streptomyces blastmyceticus]|uniref:Histidine kinase/HSP90-like ATPase domain-containing protein n=1 Tax=Streptomyces blastmyceticus TaxID=68180 RepID=A0ABN0WUJ3_9ACTN